jgi:NADPH-dependent 2,4-dienoyl-CoA reductase/sulfur reductase-like enzyme
LNPLIGREYESLFERPLTKPKKVLVAGGGVGGMEAALTAAERGHRVTLCEKSGALGGALVSERHIPFKKDVYGIIGTLKRRMELAGVEVRFNSEVDADYVRREAPDVLIVAVGAEPLMPLKGKNVVLAEDIGKAKIGRRVVVLGGGLVGCETAVFLASEGRSVTLVEMADAVAADANARQRPALLEKLYGSCRVVTGARGLYADEAGLVCDNGELIEADTIVAAAGQRPRYEVVDGLRNTAPEVKFVGDCVKAANIREAIFAGYHAGMDI